MRAGGDHRLDREHHALAQLRPGAGLPVVRDLRVLVHPAADAVPDELPHHAEAGVALDIGLAGGAEVEQAVADVALLDHPVQALLAGREQALRLAARRRRRDRDGRVADEPAVRDPDVDRQDVAVRQLVLAGDAVDDHVVRRRADRAGEPAVALERGHAAATLDVALRDPVELARR